MYIKLFLRISYLSTVSTSVHYSPFPTSSVSLLSFPVVMHICHVGVLHIYAYMYTEPPESICIDLDWTAYVGVHV